jgi:hypothetical protein
MVSPSTICVTRPVSGCVGVGEAAGGGVAGVGGGGGR